jgi:hypothetical protein
MYVTRFSFSHKLAVINEVKRLMSLVKKGVLSPLQKKKKKKKKKLMKLNVHVMFSDNYIGCSFYLYQKLNMAYIKRLISFHNAASLKHKAINRKTICMHYIYIYMKIKVGSKIVKIENECCFTLGIMW